MRKQETVIFVLVVLALFAAMGCENAPTPTPTPTPVNVYEPLCDGCDISTPSASTATPTATLRPPRPQRPTATPTPTRTPVPSVCETQPQYCPTATPTPTPTPSPEEWAPRYQVFADDIDLIEEHRPHFWNWTNCTERIEVYEKWKQQAEDQRAKGFNFPDPHRPIWTPCTNELEQRIQLLPHEPEPEQAKYWPGICRALDEQVYIPALYRRTVESDDLTRLFQKGDLAPIFNWHVGELRRYLTTECAEYVPYVPYPPAPDMDCSDYDYREDAEEAAWTYWYAEDINDVVDHQFSSTWGTTTEIVCGYLPSRR